MAAGSIIIDLLMRTGSFQTDTARAAKSLKTLRKESEDTAKAIKASFAGNLLSDVAQQIGTFLGRLPGEALAAVDAFNDLKDATGSSIENISALDRTARETGTSFETVSTALLKMNKVLADAKPGSEQAAIFKSLNLSIADLRRLDPAEAFLQVAKRLNEFADNGKKGQLTTALFGKSLAEIAPLLKDVAEKGELVAKTTTEQAEAVEAYRKQSFRLKADIEDLGRSLLINLIPYLTSATQQIKEMFGASAGSETLNRRIVNALQEVENEQARFEKGESLLDIVLYGTKESRAKSLAEAKKRLEEARAAYQAVVGTSNAGAGRGSAQITKPSAPDVPDTGSKKDLDADYKALIRSIKEKISLDQAELASDVELNEAQKLRAKILADIAAGTLTLTKAQKANVDAKLAELGALEESLTARKKELDYLKEAGAENIAFLEGLRSRRDALEQEAKQQRIAADEFGKTREEIEAMGIARDKAAASRKENLATLLDEIDPKAAAAYREQAKALREIAAARQEVLSKTIDLQTDPLTGAAQGVKDYLDTISRAGEATERIVSDSLHGLEEALLSKDPVRAAKALVQDLIREFYRLLVIRPLMQSITGSAGGGWQALLSLFSGSAGNLQLGSTTITPQLVGEFAAGSAYVPRTGLALVHEGEKITPRGQDRGGNVIVNRVPANYTVDASWDGQGNRILEMREIARAEINRAARPGGLIRRSARHVAPDRA